MIKNLKQFFTKKDRSQQSDDLPVKQEIAQHPSIGLTPDRLSQILEQAERGNLIAQAELFMDMEEKDGHIQAEMHKRKMAVIGLDWTLQAPNDASTAEKQQAAALEAQLRDRLDIEDLLFDALDAIGHGYSCLELDWKNDKNGWFPEIKHRSPRWFTVNPHHPDKIRLRTANALYGEELNPYGWIIHIHKSRSGALVRTGIHRALAWPYLFKNYSVRDLAELLEIYGLPIKVGKYSPGASEHEKKTLMQAVMGIGHNAGGIIPDSMQMDFITASSSAGSDPFKAMIDWCEATQSKVILGNALSSMGSQGGSQALGRVHNEVRLDIRNSDARQLANTLTRDLITPLVTLNQAVVPERLPKFVFDTQETDDLALYADALPKLAQAGAQIPLSYVHDKLKIPVPEGDEPILTTANTLPVAALIGTNKQKQDKQDKQDIADALSVQLAEQTARGQQQWLAQIHQVVSKSDSLEALRDTLLAQYGDLKTETLTQVMSLAFAAAELSGRFDVQEGG